MDYKNLRKGGDMLVRNVTTILMVPCYKGLAST